MTSSRSLSYVESKHVMLLMLSYFVPRPTMLDKDSTKDDSNHVLRTMRGEQ